MNNLNQFPTNNQFSIRLADGKEQTFASAAEMAKWMQTQRELDYSRRSQPNKRKSAQRRPARRRSAPASPRDRRWDNSPPLARFAKAKR